MNITQNPMPGMGMYGIIPIITIIGALVRELLLMFLIFKGIQVANVYIKNNKDNKNNKNNKDNGENSIE